MLIVERVFKMRQLTPFGHTAEEAFIRGIGWIIWHIFCYKIALEEKNEKIYLIDSNSFNRLFFSLFQHSYF